MKDILDGEFLRQDKKILSKDDFIQRLKIWKQISKAGTLGDVKINIGRAILLKVKQNDNTVWNVHNDTTRDAVIEFLTGKENPWVKSAGPRGGIVLTNSKNGTRITGFYVYLE
jgi:hypothetical protein